MAEFRPPVRVTVAVTGRTERHANIGAALIAWALENAGVPHVELDNVTPTDLGKPSEWNPVILGDVGFTITARQDPESK